MVPNEPVMHNLSTKTRMSRDRLAVFLAAMAVISLVLSRSNLFPWLEGRLNGHVPGLLLNMIGFWFWIAFVGWLLVRVLQNFRTGTGTQKALWLLLLAVVLAPWLILPRWDATSAFESGFYRWVASNLDASALRTWSGSVPESSMQPVASPLWWPTWEYGEPVGVPIAETSWPRSILTAQPDDVRALPQNGGLILAWQGRYAGWSRLVVVGPIGQAPPVELTAHPVIWRTVGIGLHAGVMEPH